jgi:hypothetical protein
VLARRDLGLAFALLHHKPRLTLGLVHLLPVPRPAGQRDLSVGQFPLPPLDIGLGGAGGALGRLLLDGRCRLEQRQVAAVDARRADPRSGRR